MNKSLLRVLPAIITIWIIAFNGCGGGWWFRPQADPVRNDHFVIVTAGKRDTLQSLARTYLGDRRKAHWIAAFNGIQSVEGGTRVVIPLKPVVPGGLRADGYQTVPVLLYSRIVPDAAKARGVTAGMFEAHLKYLRTNGYSTISLDNLADFLDFKDQPPAKAVVITFDTAERWVYDLAYPILKRFGYTAAVFIASDRIGRPQHLTWAELAEMAADGFDIGAGGAAAPSPAALSESDPAYLKRLEDQLRQPQKVIAEHLDTECRYFAYPDGETNDMTVAFLKKLGYRAAFTRRRGSNPFFADNYRLHRSTIAPRGKTAQLRRNLETFVSMDLR